MRTLCIAALLLVLVSPTIVAGEGRIPLWEPTTITQSGRYIVTRDIGTTATPAPPRAITIEADDVDIDLNGFTLRLGEPVVLAENVRNVALHGGKITGYEDALRFTNVDHFVIRRVQISSWEDPAIIVSGRNGLLEDNQIQYSTNGLYAAGSGIDILRNEIRGPSAGIVLQDCIGCKVRGNTLTGGSRIHAEQGATGSVILDNVLSGEGGWGDGITVEGKNNHVEGNVVTAFPGFGLFFTESSAGNVYRKNTARGNGGTGCTSPPDFCNHGSGNSTRGDNFMPGMI